MKYIFLGINKLIKFSDLIGALKIHAKNIIESMILGHQCVFDREV